MGGPGRRTWVRRGTTGRWQGFGEVPRGDGKGLGGYRGEMGRVWGVPRGDGKGSEGYHGEMARVRRGTTGSRQGLLGVLLV